MLLTLATRSLRLLVSGKGDDSLSLLEIPAFAIEQLELRGLNVPSSMLTGWSLEDLDRLRDFGDKAGCPCLVLIEDTPLAFASTSQSKRNDAADRLRRLAVAANRLGCNAVAIHCASSSSDDALDTAAAEIRATMPAIERHELNLLIAPSTGLTEDPQRLTELLKRIGGFRIGSLPDFGHAAATGELIATLRHLAPYAGAVHATIQGFDKKGTHQGYDLAEAVQAVRSVGFVNTLAIDFVGEKDPVASIQRAREILLAAIDAD